MIDKEKKPLEWALKEVARNKYSKILRRDLTQEEINEVDDCNALNVLAWAFALEELIGYESILKTA